MKSAPARAREVIVVCVKAMVTYGHSGAPLDILDGSYEGYSLGTQKGGGIPMTHVRYRGRPNPIVSSLLGPRRLLRVLCGASAGNLG